MHAKTTVDTWMHAPAPCTSVAGLDACRAALLEDCMYALQLVSFSCMALCSLSHCPLSISHAWSTCPQLDAVIHCTITPALHSASALHVQSALDMLRKDPEVLRCYNDRWDAIWYAELGSSEAVLNAGYNIASLLHRYIRQSALVIIQGSLSPV